GRGISREGSLLDVGVDLGVVKKSGAWFTYQGEQLGQGRENSKQFLAENPQVMVEIAEEIRQHVGLGASLAGDAPAPALDPDDEIAGESRTAIRRLVEDRERRLPVAVPATATATTTVDLREQAPADNGGPATQHVLTS